MPRVLLADDSPHAQRMGERIFREEGFEVVTVTDGDTALIRLEDVDPDLVVADALLPQRSGYEVCRLIKAHPRFVHTRVLLTIGAMEPLDEAEAGRVQADGIIRKPFEASTVLEMAKPLLDAAFASRGGPDSRPPAGTPVPHEVAHPKALRVPKPIELDPERVRAAVVLALEAALPSIVDEITVRVLVAMRR
jgi:CheY-like chemotaxis protein